MREVATHVSYNHRSILLCLALGCVVGIVAAVLNPPRFTAESLLLVRTGAVEAAQEGLAGPQVFQGGEAVQRLLGSEVQIIRSEPVIRAASTRLREDGARSGDPKQDPAAFARDLKVEIQEGSNILSIGFSSRDRAEALAAVRAVLDAYAAQRSDLYVNASRARQDSEIARYGQALGRTEMEIQRIRQDYDVLDIDVDVGLASERLETLVQRSGQVEERKGVVAAELSAVAGQLSVVPARLLDSQERTNTTPNDEARNTLLRLRQDRVHLVEQYNDDWPGLAEIDARIAAAQAQIVENSQDIRSSDRTVRNPVTDLLTSRRATLTIELASLRRQAAEIATQLTVARSRVSALRDAGMRLHDLERDQTASETIHRSLLIGRAGASLQDQAVDDRNTTLRIVQAPTAPLTGRDLRPTLLLAGGALGIGLAIMATAVGMALRQTFVTPREAQASLGMDALMSVDEGPGDAGPTAAERLTALLQMVANDDGPARLIQLVGDDAVTKSRWGLAVARVMATQGLGPVLLIDTDAADLFRRKAGDAIRRLPAGAGHLDVAQSTSSRLWVSVNPADTPLASLGASTQEARAFLTLMATVFARIVVVGALDVEAPSARRLHGLVDATILLVRAEATRAPAMLRTREAVLAAGGDILGFVFTGRRHHLPEALYRWL